jgi:general secretion pathway protein G
VILVRPPFFKTAEEGPVTPKDPWRHDSVYLSPDSEGREYEIISYGADGEPGGEGNNADIKTWELQ